MARTAISSRRQTPGGVNVTDSGHRCTPSLRVFSLSGLDAAAKVLVLAGKPMNTEKMVAKMLAKGLRKTGGRTPAATIYAAILTGRCGPRARTPGSARPTGASSRRRQPPASSRIRPRRPGRTRLGVCPAGQVQAKACVLFVIGDWRWRSEVQDDPREARTR